MLWDAELMLRMLRIENAERIRSAQRRRLLRTLVATREREGDRPQA